MVPRKAALRNSLLALAVLMLVACSILLSAPSGSQVPTGVANAPSAFVAAVAEGCMKDEPGARADAFSSQLRGTDLPPIRQIFDPWPTFSGVAVDPGNNRVVMTDINRKSVLIYDRASGNNSREVTSPRSQIMGPDTLAGFLAGVALDPDRHEIFAVNNDIEDSLAVFSYDQAGDAKPLRALVVPHQSWGLSLIHKRNEIAVSVQQVDAVFVYRREAQGVEPPVRAIQGPRTRLADPHGIYADETHQEFILANHGNWRNEYTEDKPQRVNAVSYRDVPPGGRFFPPSISVYPLAANGDTPPLRVIQGPKAALNYPMALDVDLAHDEIFVANNGDNSILVFSRTAAGDAAPVRVIRGDRTGLDLPIGIAVDANNDEIWVTNSNSHTAVVFPRNATGNAAPSRIIRNAPPEAPLVGFTNPMALSYDTKRDEILVPN